MLCNARTPGMLIGSSPLLPWLNTAAGNGPLPSGSSQKPANSLPSLRYDVRHCSYGTRFCAVASIVRLPDRAVAARPSYHQTRANSTVHGAHCDGAVADGTQADRPLVQADYAFVVCP